MSNLRRTIRRNRARWMNTNRGKWFLKVLKLERVKAAKAEAR